MRVVKSVVPESYVSVLAAKSNYFDCFCADFRSEKEVTSELVLQKMFVQQTYSKWVIFLFWIRHFLSNPLKNFKNTKFLEIKNENTKIDIGSKVGPFSIELLDDKETLLQANTSFLKVYVSIHVVRTDSEYELYLTTCNFYKNIFGHVYFFIIKPFHELIIKSMIKKCVKNLKTIHHNL